MSAPGMFFVLVFIIILLTLPTGMPIKAHKGPRLPTKANAGPQKPRQPTQAQDSPRKPMWQSSSRGGEGSRRVGLELSRYVFIGLSNFINEI